MTVHSCPRCGYNTTNATNFKKHLKRAKICDPTVEDVSLEETKNKYFIPKPVLVECPKCMKGFSSTFGLKKHVNKCTATPLAPLEDIVPTNEASTSAQAAKIAQLEKEIAELKEMFKSGMHIENQQNNHVENTHIENQQINIVINEFGAEKVSHLFEDVEFMKECFTNYEHGLVRFILKKWFDKNHPENRCIEMFADMVKYYQRKQWLATPVNEKFMDMIMDYVGCDYQTFLEKNPVFEKEFLDMFMERIGDPLQWDLEHSDYEYNGESHDVHKKMIREKLHNFVIGKVFKRR